MRRKLLITGGAGFVGSNLAAWLAAHGDYALTVLDDESLGKRAHIDVPVEFIAGDLLDPETLARAIEGAAAVVHLAAHTRVVESLEDPRANFEANVVGTFRLLEAARRAGVRRVVFASTGGAILGEAPAPISESMAARPLSPYGASKLAGEGYCDAFAAAYGLSTVALRFSNLYGPRSFHKGSVIAQFFKQLLRGEELTVYGDGSQVRDFLYVGDLMRAIHRALEVEVTGPVQLGSGRPTRLDELLAAIRATVGPSHPLRVRFAPARPGEVHTTWCDIRRARESLDFSPATSLADGLAATWRWFRRGATA